MFFTVFWTLAGLAFFALKFNLLQRYDVRGFLTGYYGSIVLYGFGAISLATGLYFMLRSISQYRDARKFVHRGELGLVQISPYAVRELATEIVRNEIGLDSFHIDLSHHGEGIMVEVRATVDADADIGDLGERLQKTLRNQIMSQTGLTIEQVDFYTQGVKKSQGLTEIKEEKAPREEAQEGVSLGPKEGPEEGADNGA